MKKYLLYPLLITFVAAGIPLSYNYLSQSTPDVRYTLTDPITVSLFSGDGNPENVQVIDVKNLGNAKSEKILIKISSGVTANRVDLNSKDDKPSIFLENGEFELVYQELPPKGAFKVTLKSQTPVIAGSNISVSDMTGPVKLALDSSNEPSTLTSFYWVTVFFYFPVMIFFLMTVLADSTEIRLRHGDADKILKAKKPFYIRFSRWQKIMEGSLRYKIERDYGQIEETFTAKILRAQKPDDFEEDKWGEIIGRASKRMVEMAKYMFSLESRVDLEKYARSERPTNMDLSDWEKMVFVTNRAYQEITLRELTRDRGLITQFLGREKQPIGISDDTWSGIQEKLREDLFRDIRHKTLMSDEPFNHLQEIDLKCLTDKQRVELLSQAYEMQFGFFSFISVDEAKTFLSAPRPEWLEPWKLTALENRATRIIEIDEEDSRLLEERRTEISSLKAKQQEADKLKEELQYEITKVLNEYRSLKKGDDGLQNSVEYSVDENL